MKRLITFITVLSLILGPANMAFAAVSPEALPPSEPYDPDKIIYETNNNILFRQNGNESGNATCNAAALPPTSTKIDAQTLKGINDLKSIYVQGEQQTGVMWELIAALDYRESNNGPNQSMLGGEPLGAGAVDSQFHPTTKLESIIDGMIILKGKKPIYGVDPTKPMTFIQLQEAALTYNRGSSYKTANQPVESSPYVMSKYDAAHMNMVFPNIPGETLAGRHETRYGAMTVLANLLGAENSGSGDAGCISGDVGAKVNYTGLYPDKPAGTLTAAQLCEPYADRPDFKLMAGPACVSFIAMAAKYQQVFGKRMPVGQGGGYRSAAQQIACGGTKDNPGGYNPNCIYYDPNNDPPEHLWGTAIDFSGPLGDKGTPEHKWLVTTGPSYGWFWPNWASGGRGGNAGVEEDWHFAYYFVGHNPNSDKLESYK